jgi:outer membrane protein TolC
VSPAIRTAEERIRIARENVETQEESLKIAEARFRYGTRTQLDVEQARTALLNTLASIRSAELQAAAQSAQIGVVTRAGFRNP